MKKLENDGNATTKVPNLLWLVMHLISVEERYRKKCWIEVISTFISPQLPHL